MATYTRLSKMADFTTRREAFFTPGGHVHASWASYPNGERYVVYYQSYKFPILIYDPAAGLWLSNTDLNTITAEKYYHRAFPRNVNPRDPKQMLHVNAREMQIAERGGLAGIVRDRMLKLKHKTPTGEL